MSTGTAVTILAFTAIGAFAAVTLPQTLILPFELALSAIVVLLVWYLTLRTED